MMRDPGWLGGAIMILPALLLLDGCDDPVEVTSHWRDREVTVDGEWSEWEGATTYLEEAGLAVGVLNDANFLYLSLASANRSTQLQVLGSGLTVWFDRDGGSDKEFGVRFPLGMRTMGLKMGGRSVPPEVEELDEILEESSFELEIMASAAAEPARMLVTDAEGLEVQLQRSKGSLVYELRVPLNGNAGYSYAVGTEPGATIGVGLETPEIDMSEMRQRRGGGRGGGMGRGGVGGGMGRMPGGRSDGDHPQRPEPLRAWAKVELATGSEEDLSDGEGEYLREAIPVSRPLVTQDHR
jgi:hypothetical protein